MGIEADFGRKANEHIKDRGCDMIYKIQLTLTQNGQSDTLVTDRVLSPSNYDPLTSLLTPLYKL